ncbi:synaptotagmin-like protein 1 isoform X1 [Bufo gargarizans]|uniref:synaptotagmin-like protein 1 isoform X1 n=1 Tax=Bufo gargarizans TaxID=30331 RepID=UPI001CF56DB9|nr:synaptotagmin-like protein 1 isoform X1 [Bufo gargarizans]XP_044161524.1 synaptotagmin-like protein 1 isoform X1 [Bufo gargarizans]XP_044161525.1 synaptotagmin-like protein 1 isoform X1 [Bufo gargarizans]XP_044161526.1 synaptotagmin-like protein 1 isoform X1 [Bufo gargarizans]XP_044161527.1 synaptotagmin-like protein 1 isoform X1 [Bufo gargarizans]
MKNSSGTMLDLSFLTDEEYEKLMNVLQRDAELQKKDGDRIRRLQGSLKDEKKKKFVTGEWFHDVKFRRFKEDLQGSELLRASIRKKRNLNQSVKNGKGDGFKEAIHNLSTHGELDSQGQQSPVDGIYDRTASVPQLHIDPSVEPEASSYNSPEKRSLNGNKPVDRVTNEGLSPSSETRSFPERGEHGSILQESSAPNKNLISRPVPLARKLSSPEKSPNEESGSPSKIPVKRKTSREASKTDISPQSDHSSITFKKTETLAQSGLSSPETEQPKNVKTNANFEVHSMKEMQGEQDSILDKDQFISLRKFWEKGAGNSGNASQGHLKQEAEDAVNLDESPAKPNHSVTIQYTTKVNSEERSLPEYTHRLKYFSQRPQVVSSSEDEMVHVVPHRKTPSSSIPRSTYAKSKGSSNSRSMSVSESNGTTSHSEDNSGVNRSSKKSKLPVRASSVVKETKGDPTSSPKDKLPVVSVPEITDSVEEIIVPQSKPKVAESLYSKVQILIDTVSSDEEQGGTDKKPKSEDKTGHSPLESENGRSSEDYPEDVAASKSNNVSNARSMVNIYTTTETYNKPNTLSHQLLEPERAKELSRSTPALHSETESDTASEISFNIRKHRKTLSGGSNSSDMASVSSVSNSVLSVYSGDFGSVDAQGTVQFSLDYDEKNREFQIYVAQCRDLAVVDEKKGRSDPYVKTYLLPDKARMGKRKTSVKRKTTNPIYNEVLRYKIEKMVLLIQKLNLSVWHNDPLGRNSFLGELEIDLTSWDWSNTKPNWYTLKPRSLSAMNGVDHLGVMNLSIRYIPPGSLGPKHPASGEVHIWVKDTKDLPQLRPSGVDSFVKCYVLPDTSKKSYQKTRVIKKDPNPVFNHTIVYDGFHTEDLKDACVELTVWDHEKLSNHFLGGIRLGLGTGYSYGIVVDWMDSTQEEVALWQEMMMTPNEWIEGSLPLRSLAGRRKFK